MNMQIYKIVIFPVSFLVILLFALNSCASKSYKQSQNEIYKHNTPLIKKDIRKKVEEKNLIKQLEMGPKTCFWRYSKLLNKREKNII